MSDSSASRLARGIGAFCLACVVASLVLVALDWRVIKSPDTALLSSFLSAIVAITGVMALMAHTTAAV
jgi:inner membrane protein involved in colicin E2 resistance